VVLGTGLGGGREKVGDQQRRSQSKNGAMRGKPTKGKTLARRRGGELGTNYSQGRRTGEILGGGNRSETSKGRTKGKGKRLEEGKGQVFKNLEKEGQRERGGRV